MIIKPFTTDLIPQAAELAAANHAAERQMVPSLPARQADHYVPMLERILSSSPGVAAVDESNTLMGYIVGWRIQAFKGLNAGIHVPEWANAATGENRYELIRRLYQEISPKWLENGCLTHAVSLFAHDEVAIKTWFHTSFGMICADGTRHLTPVAGGINGNIQVRQATVEDIDLFLPLVHEHSRYYPEPPLFMPLLSFSGREHYQEWLLQENNILWLAFNRGELIGYFESCPSHKGARELIRDKGTISICGAYVKPSQREERVGSTLLSNIVNWAKETGFERCAVDYETHNIHGSRFWEKHFTPVTRSLIRRIDERVVWAHSKRSASSMWE